MKEEFHDCDYYDSDLSVYITAKIDIFVTFFLFILEFRILPQILVKTRLK